MSIENELKEKKIMEVNESQEHAGESIESPRPAQVSEYFDWAKQLVRVYKLSSQGEDADSLADKLSQCFETVQRRTAESIGDIQVKQECVGPNEFAFKAYVNGVDTHHQADTADMGILLALGMKHFGRSNEATDFARFAGRMLRLKSNWLE